MEPNATANPSDNFTNKTLKLIEKISEDNEFIYHEFLVSEVELMGMLHGFLAKSKTDLKVEMAHGSGQKGDALCSGII